MQFPRTARLGALKLVPLSLVPLFLSSCVLVAKETKEVGPESAGPNAPATAAKVEPAGKAEAKAKAAARKAEKRAFDLELARTELALAELEVGQNQREAEQKLQKAREGRDEAKRALEHFMAKLPRELEESQLSLDRQTQGKLEAEQELREMEATYAKDQFATDTKELVLMRHRKRLEFAERGLRIAHAEFTDKRDVELPKAQREAERRLRESEQSVADAEHALERTKLSSQMQLARKRWAMQELERPADEDNGKGD
ncbi:MAG: hypothetical protein HUU28_11320 [Planctomycetaceae bacterium]|nr:hypothetical protein [Planctomycetaceae bacterium]